MGTAAPMVIAPLVTQLLPFQGWGDVPYMLVSVSLGNDYVKLTRLYVGSGIFERVIRSKLRIER